MRRLAAPLLGVNIDHVATVRQARREDFPDTVTAALDAVRAGANGITAHLREDRRHIQDHDIIRLRKRISVPLNMEMAASNEIVRIAKKVRPAWACLVPERREELTTEGDLNILKEKSRLKNMITALHASKIRVSLFIDSDLETVMESRRIGADAIEIHTGTYARLFKKNGSQMKSELNKIARAAVLADGLGLLVNAGHGIDYANVGELAKIFPFHEFNIGFSIIARSFRVGLANAVKEMKEKIHISCAAS
jgi:pyridoxine 5-phosphate synthase